MADYIEQPLELSSDSPLHFDGWTGQYSDQFNDLWVRRPSGRGLWVVATREPGNRTLVHSRHRNLSIAIAAGERLARQRNGQSCAHCRLPAITELDGDHLCQIHADAWVRGEGLAAAEREQIAA